jgi:hypothetical protein
LKIYAASESRNFELLHAVELKCLCFELIVKHEHELIVKSFEVTVIRRHLFDTSSNQLVVTTSTLHSCPKTMLETGAAIQDEVSLKPDLDELDNFGNENDPGISAAAGSSPSSSASRATSAASSPEASAAAGSSRATSSSASSGYTATPTSRRATSSTKVNTYVNIFVGSQPVNSSQETLCRCSGLDA